MNSGNRSLQIIKNGSYFELIISELTLIRINKDYDLGWGETYSKRLLNYYENNSEELLKLIDKVRKTGKFEVYN